MSSIVHTTQEKSSPRNAKLRTHRLLAGDPQVVVGYGSELAAQRTHSLDFFFELFVNGVKFHPVCIAFGIFVAFIT